MLQSVCECCVLQSASVSAVCCRVCVGELGGVTWCMWGCWCTCCGHSPCCLPTTTAAATACCCRCCCLCSCCGSRVLRTTGWAHRTGECCRHWPEWRPILGNVCLWDLNEPQEMPKLNALLKLAVLKFMLFQRPMYLNICFCCTDRQSLHYSFLLQDHMLE